MNRLPASPLIMPGLELAEKRLGIDELSRRLRAPETEIRAWRLGHAAMPDDTFLRLVDPLLELEPDWLNARKPS